MKPYFERDGITIYHGDCREVLPGLAPVDLVLTDPPYGLGDRWSGGGTWQHHRGIYAEARRWDQNAADIGLLLEIIAKADRAIVWGYNYFPLPPSRGFLAWVKASSMETVADLEIAWTNIDYPAKLYRKNRNPDGRRSHPTQKPLDLMRWCIERASIPSRGLVLDPFMGSGTTLRAALDLGRKAIGIEIEERYCEIAARRLDQMAMNLEVPA